MRVALFQPDIAPNVGAAMRLCACMGVGLDVIGPCGFPWDINKIRKAGMDYMDAVDLIRHDSWDEFIALYPSSRLVLMTTKGHVAYTDFSFHEGDILLAGRESAGVPDCVRDYVQNHDGGQVYIPMRDHLRSLNIVNATSMILGEALRQIKICE